MSAPNRPRIGELRERVTIEQLSTSTSTSSGEPIPSWTTLQSVFARVAPAAGISPRAGSEMFHGGKVEHELTMLFTIRARNDVTENMRIQWNSRTWNIIAILTEGEREFIYILGHEVK